MSNIFKSIKFKIEDKKVLKSLEKKIDNNFYEDDLWNSFVHNITSKELNLLNEIQRKAVICFWYDSEINSGGHNSFFEIYSNYNSKEVYNALKEISTNEIANNYKNALKNKSDNEKEDYIFYKFDPSLSYYLQKYVDKNKDEILKNENFIYRPKTIKDLNYNVRELYNKIIQNNKVKGTIKLYSDKVDYISWNIYDDYFIEISFDYHDGYININKKEKNEKIQLTHWHPEFDEVYNDFLELNDKDSIIVVWVKRMSSGYDIYKKNEFKKEKYKNNSSNKYYIIGE